MTEQDARDAGLAQRKAEWQAANPGTAIDDQLSSFEYGYELGFRDAWVACEARIAELERRIAEMEEATALPQLRTSEKLRMIGQVLGLAPEP